MEYKKDEKLEEKKQNDDDDDDFDQEACEHEMEILDEMYPDINFTICIPINTFGDIVTQSKKILVINRYNCYCYSENPRVLDHFVVTGTENNPITYKKIIDVLAKKFNPACAHRFLEQIDEISEDIFEIFCGS